MNVRLYIYFMGLRAVTVATEADLCMQGVSKKEVIVLN